MMNTSIIIPTYNGAHKIFNLLQSLEKQSYKNFEVIVVIDGSNDNTKGIIDTHKFNFQSFRIIEQANEGRAAVRNNGAKAAKGELLIFFDDDIIPESNCVELHVAHHEKFPNSILAGVARMNKFHDVSNDFFQYRYFIEDSWQLPFKDKLTEISYDNYAFTSSNLSVPKLIFDQLNGFDVQLKDSEDFDLSIRALKAHIPIYYDYKVWAWHCDYVNIRGYINRQKDYLKSKRQLALLKPEYLNLHSNSFSREERTTKRKRLLMKLFYLNSFWEIIINSKLFLFLIPQSIRFKLYSILIFSSSGNQKAV